MLVIPISSTLHQELTQLVTGRRMIFVSGIPGVGKSLLIQQMSLLAQQAGRQVHLLQYNVAREPFENARNLRKYPEVDGFTDPAIRKAVGLWARHAVQQWLETHADPTHLLIGELPLIGNRFIELAEIHDDQVEAALSSQDAIFVVPVPSWEVREVIEERRASSIADPQHEREKLDAPPNVLQALWEEVNRLARTIQLTKTRPQTPYNPYIYGGVYQALLQHRQTKLMLIDQVLRPQKSVYETAVRSQQLQATADEVNQFIELVESRYTPEALKAAVHNWHALITDNPQPVDRGPELRLPLPDQLPGVEARTELTAVQQAALVKLIQLPLEATPSAMLPALDEAIATLAWSETPTPTLANVHKFDVYDSYFNVTRVADQSGVAHLHGLLTAYRHVMENLDQPPHPLTVVELPLLRVALETAIRPFLRKQASLEPSAPDKEDS